MDGTQCLVFQANIRPVVRLLNYSKAENENKCESWWHSYERYIKQLKMVRKRHLIGSMRRRLIGIAGPLHLS